MCGGGGKRAAGSGMRHRKEEPHTKMHGKTTKKETQTRPRIIPQKSKHQCTWPTQVKPQKSTKKNKSYHKKNTPKKIIPQKSTRKTHKSYHKKHPKNTSHTTKKNKENKVAVCFVLFCDFFGVVFLFIFILKSGPSFLLFYKAGPPPLGVRPRSRGGHA